MIHLLAAAHVALTARSNVYEVSEQAAHTLRLALPDDDERWVKEQEWHASRLRELFQQQ
jgi:hypothetical protein